MALQSEQASENTFRTGKNKAVVWVKKCCCFNQRHSNEVGYNDDCFDGSYFLSYFLSDPCSGYQKSGQGKNGAENSMHFTESIQTESKIGQFPSLTKKWKLPVDVSPNIGK